MNGTPESRKSEFAQSASQPTLTKRERLTQERVLELFDYRENGTLVRRIRTKSRHNAGEVVGTSENGYLCVKVDGKTYKVHRIVWLYLYGYLPEHGVDHIDRVKTNNRIENLREVGQVCNQRNRGNSSNNTSGVKGVAWAQKERKWLVQICVSRENIRLGYHDCFIEAVCHRLAAEQAIGWEGCDSSSPAFQFVQAYLCKKKGLDN